MHFKVKLPENHEEWINLREHLITTHNLEDKPETWIFILSQLAGTKMPELHTTTESLVNHYKRWKIAKVLQDEKAVYKQYFEDKLKAQMEEYAKSQEALNEGISPSEHTEHMQDGTHHFEGELPPLPSLEKGVEPDPSERRF